MKLSFATPLFVFVVSLHSIELSSQLNSESFSRISGARSQQGDPGIVGLTGTHSGYSGTSKVDDSLDYVPSRSRQSGPSRRHRTVVEESGSSRPHRTELGVSQFSRPHMTRLAEPGFSRSDRAVIGDMVFSRSNAIISGESESVKLPRARSKNSASSINQGSARNSRGFEDPVRLNSPAAPRDLPEGLPQVPRIATPLLPGIFNNLAHHNSGSGHNTPPYLNNDQDPPIDSDSDNPSSRSGSNNPSPRNTPSSPSSTLSHIGNS